MLQPRIRRMVSRASGKDASESFPCLSQRSVEGFLCLSQRCVGRFPVLKPGPVGGFPVLKPRIRGRVSCA